MAKPKLGIDLDDVLFDFVGHFFRWHNQRYGTRLRFSDMTHEKLWQAWGGSPADAGERVPAFFGETDMLPLEPLPGAVEALGSLRDRYRLIVISARDPSTATKSEQWLERYFPAVFDQIELGLSNPLERESPMTKAEFCLQHGVTALVDDQLVNAVSCAEAGIRVLLYGDLPWNQSSELPELVRRVPDWETVVHALDSESRR